MYQWAYPPPPEEQPEDPSFQPSEEQLAELKQLFVMYDENGNGVLEFKEVVNLAAAAGYDPEEVEVLFKEADTNRDSVISFDEFIQLMRHSYIS